MTNSLQFLSGGGEMGSLIRSYNWESSPIGSAEKWPQSLRTTLSILLNSKFPMFLYWGPDLVCFYNDAYRFSLANDGKHPLILGMKGEEAWHETWHILKPDIDSVINNAEATWYEDQLIPIYREGTMKDAFWTFSFSPVKDESDQTGGVFLTLIETTEKVNNLKKIIETNNQLTYAIEATELGTFDLDPVTNKFIGNNRLKDWFGLPHNKEVDLMLAIDVIDEKDRSRVADAIKKTLEYESGGLYEIEYSLQNLVTKQERIVRAKGRAWFGKDKKAYRFNGTLQDITQQALANKKIEENEQRFRNLILQAPVLISTFEGPTYEIATINKKELDMWGKTYDEVINKPLFDVSPITEEGLKTIFSNIYNTGEPFIATEIPIQLKRQDETRTAYFNSIYQPLLDLDNKIYGIISIGTEVTETVKARKQIEESGEFNRTVLESSPDCLKVLDVEGRIQYMNFNGLFQMEIDDFSDFKNKNWVTLWGNENEAIVKAAIDKALTGATAQFTALCLTAKGTPKWWDVLVSPVGKAGEKVQQIISVSRDITEKKKSEEAIENMAAYLKLATDSANVGTWSLNMQTQALEWSDLHKKIWGYNEKNKDLTYEDWYKAIVPEDLALAFQKIEESKLNNSIYELDYRIKRANDGAVVWIKSTGQYQYDELGVAQKLTGISIDISQQKMFSEALENKVNERTEELAFKSTQLEETIQILALKNIELENSNAQLKSFTYIAGHDLQEPLRKIQIFGKLIKETANFSEKTQDYFNRIIAAGEHMQNLIVSLLDFSRTDTDKQIIVPCDLNNIVEESKKDLSLPILEKQAIIEYENLPTINGSYDQLCQLFTNLIGNAIKYSRPEIVPHIKITSERIHGKAIEHPSANKQKEYYLIKFLDNGIGFENEYATKIFELFQRLHSKNAYSGTGIGLAIVKKIATNQNGFVLAESKSGIGSMFSLFVPVQ